MICQYCGAKMKKVLEFPGCILAHTVSGTTHLLSGSRELTDLMDGDCLDDACMDEGMKTLPTDPGVYSATIEYWFSQGYFEGYPAPGERRGWDEHSGCIEE